jgi:Zn-dependent metalloprotease
MLKNDIENKSNENVNTFHKCGMTGTLPLSTCHNILNLDNPIDVDGKESSGFTGTGVGGSTSVGYGPMKIWTSYGKITVPVYSFGQNSDFVALQNPITGLDGKLIFIKCVDSISNRISPQMKLQQLVNIPATVISKSENERIGKIVSDMKENKSTNENMSHQLSVLGPVDIHWLTNEYVEFLHVKLKLNNINNDGILLSVHNVKNLDNAFFTGENMVYGDGGKTFVDMGKADVIAHELGHGIVKSTANLEYRGHSGALNEHMSDVLGVCFEFWLYCKYNKNERKDDDISGGADWLIGEDVGKAIPYLRNMRNPENAASPQPGTYKGKYWSDPNNNDLDFGGVHINSGVPNKCFFLVVKKIGLFKALRAWFRTLNKLTANSDFIDFRDTLKSCTKQKYMTATIDALNTVGLTEEAVSDWVP